MILFNVCLSGINSKLIYHSLAFMLMFLVISCDYQDADAATDFEQISEQVIERLGYDQDTNLSFKFTSHKRSQLEKETLELMDAKLQGGADGDSVLVTLVDKTSHKEYKIRATVGRLMRAMVPIRDINQGDAVTKDDLIMIKVLKKGNTQYLCEFPVMETVKVAKRRLLANEPMKVDDLVIPFAVRKGQRVRVVFKKHSLTIEAIGICLEPGSVNEIIKVKILESGKISYGTVINNEVVTITTR